METIIEKVDDWPRDAKNRISFKSTQDAIAYATLIFNLPDKIQEIRDLRNQFLKKIGIARAGVNIDFDWLFGLACKAQFYRECLEEVERLKLSTYLMQNGG